MHLDAEESRVYLRSAARKFLAAADDLSVQIKEADVWAKVGMTTICQAGCGACCRQVVSVYPLEGIAIADGLLGMPDDALVEECRRLAEATVEYTPTLDCWEFYQRAIPCTFLGPEGDCEIYDLRPSACRLYFVGAEPHLPPHLVAKYCAPSYPGEDREPPKFKRRLVNASRHKSFLATLHARLLGDKRGTISDVVAPLPQAALLGLELMTHGTERYDLVSRFTPTVEEALVWARQYTAHVSSKYEERDHDAENGIESGVDYSVR